MLPFLNYRFADKSALESLFSSFRARRLTHDRSVFAFVFASRFAEKDACQFQLSLSPLEVAVALHLQQPLLEWPRLFTLLPRKIRRWTRI